LGCPHAGGLRFGSAAQRENAADEGLLGFGAGLEGFKIGTSGSDPGPQFGNPGIVRGCWRLPRSSGQLGAVAEDALGGFVDEGRRGPLAQGHLGAGGVEHADGLVGSWRPLM
jgi:hypothetical protein